MKILKGLIIYLRIGVGEVEGGDWEIEAMDELIIAFLEGKGILKGE